jgi:geranylgeranyl diphosphate synthase type I
VVMERSAGGLELELTRLVVEIDKVLEDFLASKRRQLEAHDPDSGILVGELIRVLRSGGKRLRPLFCYWGYRAAGREHSELAVRSAASLELLHTFAILHDDVMDRSQLRRGEPTTLRLFTEKGDERGLPDPVQFGISMSILAGDLAFALSDDLFYGSGFDAQALEAASRWLNEMRVATIAGQYLDLESSSQRNAEMERARRIGRLKTGAYSVEGPLKVGAALAGAPDSLLRVLERYGMAVGEAFQIKDDLLGLFGSPEITGKDSEGDVRQGKPTIVIARALENASASEHQAIVKVWGNPEATTDEIEDLRRIVEGSGALNASHKRMEDLTLEAKEALRQEGLVPPLPLAALDYLADLIGAGASS